MALGGEDFEGIAEGFWAGLGFELLGEEGFGAIAQDDATAAVVVLGAQLEQVPALGKTTGPVVGPTHGAIVFMGEAEGGGAFDVFLALGGGFGGGEVGHLAGDR